jgi:hypothetical protein
MESLILLPTPEPGWIILFGMILVAVGAITRMRMIKRPPE